MTQAELDRAVDIYLKAEKAAMERVEGADHLAIMREVSTQTGIDYDVLREAVIKETLKGQG